MTIRIIVALIISCWAANCLGQQYDKKETCMQDTISVYRRYHIIKVHVNDTSQYYKAVKCTKVSKLGMRIDMGVSWYSYAVKTQRWLGNHRAASLGLIILYERFNFGVRWKLSTVTPRKDLFFQGDTLSVQAKVNPIKIDYFLGYTIDIRHNFTVESYIGWTRNVFHVINEMKYKNHFKFQNRRVYLQAFL